jgi:TnpA family transposase
MKSRQLQVLGMDRFPPSITEFDINQFFCFDRKERRAIVSRHGACHQAAMAIQIGFLRLTGRPLASLESVPAALLRHLRKHLQIETPDLTSLRALYRDERTLFKHQRAAAKLLGFRDFSRGRQGALSRHLQGEASRTLSTSLLLLRARQWLYELKVLVPGERVLRRHVHQAQARTEAEIASEIDAEVSNKKRKRWLKEVMKKRDAGSRTTLEWLQSPPGRQSPKTLRRQLDKLDHLRSMGVDELKLEGVELSLQCAYAADVRRRRPGRLKRLREPRRSIALVCFLAVRLRELMDEVLALSSTQGNRIVRQASERVRAKDTRVIGPLLEAIESIRAALENEELSSDQRLDQAKALLPERQMSPSFAGRLRMELSSSARQTRPMLRRLVKLPLSETGEKKVTGALQYLDRLYDSNTTRLPADADASLAPRWRELTESGDRQQAMRAFESAVLQELRTGLRAGTIWVDKSIEHRGRDALFIPEPEWKRSRDRHYRQLGLPAKPDEHLKSLSDALAAGFGALDEAVASGAVSLVGKRVGVEKLEKEPVPEQLEAGRRRLVEAVGSVELPELLVEMDTYVRFSWLLLGRAPRDEAELLAVYAALLALGTELDDTGVAAMIPGLKASTVRDFKNQLDDPEVLRRANGAAVEFLRQHAITEHWGDGSVMSSDAMSLEATRHLWKARVDPKHRRYAVGMYTHLLDQWGIVYDHPIVLGERQVGAAIDGALHQISDAKPSRLAVDTHGYTNFGMGLVKFLGFDLCPRMRDIRNRLLYAMPGLDVPKGLAEAISYDVSVPAIRRGWDGLARIASSVVVGRTSATATLRAYGSSSSSDPIYRAGVHLGRLHRTLFLLDYFTNPEFRRELLRVLNHGESVHQLQRAIYAGNITAKRGRGPGELQLISGSLTLLTNLVMAWITHRLQAAADRECKDIATPEVVRRVAPDQFSGINLRGRWRFPIAANQAVLLAPSVSVNRSRSS